MDDTPQGVKAEDVGQYVRLVMLCNDVSLRNLILASLQGFGFFTSKPSSALTHLQSRQTNWEMHGKMGAFICH